MADEGGEIGKFKFGWIRGGFQESNLVERSWREDPLSLNDAAGSLKM
jgi:hypothetical protein